jgi:MFS transporter, DHA1 family, multidrug resistance protein
VIILGALTATAPMTLDLYLPALPQMRGDLGTTESRLQLTLTAALLGIALGQAIIGPISDSIGRRKPLLVGTAVYAIASVAAALAPNVELLIGARVLQAMAGAAGIVVARAVVRDTVSGAEIARLLSMLMLVTGLAPILAPVVGGQLLQITNWRALFVVLAVFGAGLFVIVAGWLPDSLPVERRRPTGLKEIARGYRYVASNKAFLGYALALAIGFASIFAYISGSPFVFQGAYELSPQAYGLLFGINGVGLMIVSQIGGRIVRRFGSRTLLTAGQVLAFASAGLLLVASITGFGGFLGVVIPLFGCVAVMPIVGANATALALQQYPDAAGTASALLGTLQFVVAGLVGPLVTLFDVRSALPMAGVMFVCFGLGLVARFALTKQPRVVPIPVLEPAAVPK